MLVVVDGALDGVGSTGAIAAAIFVVAADEETGVATLAAGAGTGTLTTTTMDCGGWFVGAAVVSVGGTVVSVANGSLAGILATASSSLRSRSVTFALRSLASATTTSRLSRSLDNRSDERMLRVTPARVTMADRMAPAKIA